MEYDYAFEIAVSNLRFGQGTTREVGMDLAASGIKRVMVLTDPNLRRSRPVESVLESWTKRRLAILYSTKFGLNLQTNR